MTDWISSAQLLYSSNTPFVIATLWSINGASPDECGNRLLVTNTEHYGKFNSSHRMEKIISHCRCILSGENHSTLADYPLGDVAGVVNGSYRVLYTHCPTGNLPDWLCDANRHLQQHDPVVLAQTVDCSNPETQSRFTLYIKNTPHSPSDDVAAQAHQLLDRNGTVDSVLVPENTSRQTLLQKIFDNKSTVTVVGNSSVANHLVRQLQLLPFKIHWLTDDKTASLDKRTTQQDMNEASFDTFANNASVVIATGDHDKDYYFCKLALDKPALSYIGCLGSTKKAKIIRARLIQQGVPTARAHELKIPIGLASIVGKQPEIVAASIVGQLLSRRS